MNIVFMGTPEFCLPVLNGLIENYNVNLVVSQPDKKIGRKQILTPTPVKVVAEKNNIEVFQPEKIRNDYQKIVDLKPDLIVTCAYGQIIPKELLELPRLGCINVHASLLPKLRGGAPIQKSIIEGDTKTGITIMYMDEKMDNGDIITKEEVEITDDDTLESLSEKLSLVGRDLLLKTLPSIINETNSREKQNEEEVTYAYNITREEEHIDFSKTKKDIYNLIRGLYPNPAAYTLLDNQVMKVYSSKISDKVYQNKKIGEIVNIYKDGIGVNCQDGEIIFTDIKPFGKKRMAVRDYLNGTQKDKLIGKVLR